MSRLAGALCLFCLSADALTLHNTPAADSEEYKRLAAEASDTGSSPAYVSEHDAADQVRAEQENLHKDAQKDKVVRRAEETTGKVARSLTTWKSAATKADDDKSDDWAWAAGHANRSSDASSKDAKLDAAAKATQAYQQELHKDAQQDHKVIRIENVTMSTAHAATRWKNSTRGQEQFEGEEKLDTSDWAWAPGAPKPTVAPAKALPKPKPKNITKPKPLTKEEVEIKRLAQEAEQDGSSPAYLSEHDASDEVQAYQRSLHKAALDDKDVKKTDKTNTRVARSMTSWKSAGQRTDTKKDDEGLDMDDWANDDASHSNASALAGSDKAKEHDASVDVKAYQAGLHQEEQKEEDVVKFANATEAKVKTLTKWKNTTIGNEKYDADGERDDWAWTGNSSQKSNLRGN